MIVFFGTGLLGSGFVRALRKRGEEVHVWNRTAEKARKLEDSGARAFEDPAEAARGATRAHLSLSDDDAVDSVLAAAKLSPDVRIVDHTTTTAHGALARSKRFPTFVHAPVFMGPQNALESTGTMLISGSVERVEPVRAACEAMTGKLVNLGERPDAAAAFKLMGNLFLMFVTSGFADMLMLAKALDVPPAEAAKLFDHFNPGMSLKARIERVTSGNFETPSWELSMARKDARLMIEEAERAKRTLAVLPAIAKQMDEAIAKGQGRFDWTVIAKPAL
jgi:3-hydroxyisobutyrate dehydrogenase